MISGALTPLAARPGPPAIPFGHSTGALLAYELRRALVAAAAPPAALVLSAMSPAHPVDRPARRALAEDPDTSPAHVRDLGAGPPEILSTPALRALVLRTMRAGLGLLGSFPDPSTGLLPARIPVPVPSGRSGRLRPPHTAAAWKPFAEGREGICVLPDGHFSPRQDETVARLAASLAQTAASRARPLTQRP
ncbi:thioesterase domain-containing protein [Streptomyces roseolilacinus]|uniref:Thioesterase domain-containing protein n=1 Tax=Streptomyces roseolilacinus TaxID=66904 RepID=A0A918AXM1_9ACTN|nr:thioesterase domain-containing protein [Streptomyces roseolilacinus]GGP97713.1 hypothetical protein GCM10010249_15290 [Streptomyces roseolilacinus]